MSLQVANGSRVTPTRFAVLEQEVGQIKTDLSELRSEIRGYFSRTQGVWRSSWPMVVTGGAILWFVINQTITSSSSKQESEIAELKSKMVLAEQIPTIMSQNADSLRDRNDKGRIIEKMLEVQTKVLQSLSELYANGREVETQMDAMAQELNIQFANNERWKGGVQDALHEMGAKFPPAPTGPWYFPNISNRNHRSNSTNQQQ